MKEIRYRVLKETKLSASPCVPLLMSLCNGLNSTDDKCSLRDGHRRTFHEGRIYEGVGRMKRTSKRGEGPQWKLSPPQGLKGEGEGHVQNAPRPSSLEQWRKQLWPAQNSAGTEWGNQYPGPFLLLPFTSAGISHWPDPTRNQRAKETGGCNL